jgi:hypothetical protein
MSTTISRWLVPALACASLVACKSESSSGGGRVAQVAPPARAPSAKCHDAAVSIASLMEPGAPEAEMTARVAELETECKTKLLTDAEATCLADAKDQLAAIRCHPVLGPELGEVDAHIGAGKCRPVMLAMYIAKVGQLQQIPPEHREEAIMRLGIAEKVLRESCNTEDWGAEAMDCFQKQDPMTAFGCIQNVKPEILASLDRRMQEAMDNPGLESTDGGGGGGAIAATGVRECDLYLRAKKKFAGCEAAPESARKTLLATLVPLEQPWQTLRPEALAATGEAFAGVCKSARDQLTTLAASVGCR